MLHVPRVTRHRDSPGWWPLMTSRGLSAVFRCPHAHVTPLLEHEIDGDGFVLELVECRYGGCGFVGELHLLEWVVE
jgi:hypothetical protein